MVYWSLSGYWSVFLVYWRGQEGAMPTRADFLRLKAVECRALADVFRDGVARSQLLIVAEQYERLADQYDRADKGVWRLKPSV